MKNFQRATALLLLLSPLAACSDDDNNLRVIPGLDASSGTSDARVTDAAIPDAATPDTAVADAGPPVAVGLQNATATFSQTSPGSFLISAAINGSLIDNSGWAINANFVDQIAAFETLSDSPAYPGGTKLTFTLDHRYSTEHALGKFRLSFTTAARTAFADGNDGSTTPGNVGDNAIWTVLAPSRATASNGATMTIKNDSSILAQELDSIEVTYTVVASTTATGITGYRLEVLKDPSLPLNGPGLQNANGNFVLTEFSVTTQAP